MNSRWVLNACMVLAVGVGLVSCTKEQIEQAMNRPAEVILQSSPCQPAGIASTATPEFCVNVTDIQLLNRDRQADVSLTLVNRTGRRLFIYASGTPSLTDSGGTKWSGGSNTGLGSGTHYPVTLEPNVETQGSFTFHQNGQATPDQIFSLRAEIVIMKVDSRGQPIPFGIAVTRGFNLSGIRLPQLPPQSSTPTEQNRDTKLAQVSPRDVTPATPKAPSTSNTTSSSTASPSSSADADSEPIAIDVVGLRLGMSPAEVGKVFKQRHLDNGILLSQNPAVGKILKVFTFRDIATGQQITIKDSEYVSTMRGFYDAGPIVGAQREEVAVEFTPRHNREQLVIIWRRQYYSAGNQPAADTFLKSLQDKYGSNMVKGGCDINGLECQYVWHYRQDGKLIRNISNECIDYEKYLRGIPNIPDIEKKSNKCGSILVGARMSGRNGLVDSVDIVAHDVELNLSTRKSANATMEAAEKEHTDRQMQKARTQKPTF
jgi:hypothetical protein